MVETSGTPAGGRLVGGAAARLKANPVQRAADLSSEVPIDHSEVDDDAEEADVERRSAVCVARYASSVQSSPRCMSSIWTAPAGGAYQQMHAQ